MATENVHMRVDGEQDGHRYHTSLIVTLRDGPALTEGKTNPEKGLATLANFAFIVDGNPAAPYEPYIVTNQVPKAREYGVQYLCMRCRPGSADWERLPRIGFDAPLDKHLLDVLKLSERPEGVSGPTVRAVLETEAGRVWWHEQGSICPIMYFDCAEGSEASSILAELVAKVGDERGGPMREIAPDEWQHPIPRPRLSEAQRVGEALRLARWSDAWHDHLVEVYMQAAIEQIQHIGEDDLTEDEG
jgi:hypothetical protein